MTGRRTGRVRWVLGVDSGGSGFRIALAPVGSGVVDLCGGDAIVSEEPVRTGPAGIDAAALLERLLPTARTLLGRAGAPGPDAIAIGAAGMATLGDELRAVLPAALGSGLGANAIALAADAVTAYVGALGQRPGVVVAAGTGMVALGTDLATWRRADGWGHLLGDRGGGAWIGRAGFEAALCAHDGRAGGSAALLARLEKVFGPPDQLPGLLYPRSDRPALLASFAPEVAACAVDDPVASRVLEDAAGHITAAAAAVCPPPTAGECEVALTGGLFKLGEPLLAPLSAALSRRLPHARLVAAAGDPLAGALTVAAALATERLIVPRDGRLLRVTTGR
ncbi:BadF/BadG/BcrA/BcrD ATPase family protein [Streptomyces sp. SCSIO 30461]|uniref:BadF/BadG/BcrA/BcrD ATPase family protein n=1 Tax=Streptomyces sp. SCSIO 30461 TaxID=3118085 RepID=UPI0030CF740A